MLKFSVLSMALFMLLACSDMLTKSDKEINDDRYFADASECYRTSQKKEKVNVMMSGNKDHGFAFPITIDIPVTYDAGAFKNCMIYAGHKAPSLEADPTAYMEISRRCMDQARGEENTNEAYAYCVQNGDITVDVIESKKGNPLRRHK